jgi:signal transduction histidine kinase
LLGNTGTRFHLNAGIGSERFPYQLEISLYRIVSELMNNSLKHGKPRLIWLSLDKQAGHISLNYTDDGAGFNPDQLFPNQGMGLDNIRSRVKSLKGLFRLESAPGKGINVTIQVPLR